MLNSMMILLHFKHSKTINFVYNIFYYFLLLILLNKTFYLIPVIDTPSTKYFCANKNTNKIGITVTVEAAIT